MTTLDPELEGRLTKQFDKQGVAPTAREDVLLRAANANFIKNPTTGKFRSIRGDLSPKRWLRGLREVAPQLFGKPEKTGRPSDNPFSLNFRGTAEQAEQRRVQMIKTLPTSKIAAMCAKHGVDLAGRPLAQK
jgi:hypothetical protein